MLLLKFITITFFLVLIFTCTFGTGTIETLNYMKCFPLGNGYTWEYEREKLVFENNTLKYQIVDTVTYSMKFDSIRNYTPYYSYYEEDRIIDSYYSHGNTVYSIFHPTPSDKSKFIFWKRKINLNEEWKSFRLTYVGPRLFYEIKHKAISFNEILNSKRREYRSCVLIERSYIALASYEEECYYANEIGMVFIKGESKFLYRRIEYNLELIKFSK